MTPAEAKNTFHKLMLQSQKRKLTLTERERLTAARQALRRSRRPVMNKRRPAKNTRRRPVIRKNRKSAARGPARRPKQNGRCIRMGKLVELRYERDHGSKPGFYKHEFRSKPVIFYYPASNKIVIEGR